MAKLSKNEQRYVYIAAAVAAAYLLYRWWQARQAPSSTGVTAPNTSSSDYAGLAGQEQGDVAALQSQNQELMAQEQADIAGLHSDVSNLTAQEQADIAGVNQTVWGLGGTVGSLSDALDKITGQVSDLTGATSDLAGQVAALGTGAAPLDRTTTMRAKTVPLHRGGPLYNYYKRVTGKTPPARLATTNFIYQAWKAGVKSTALGGHGGRHPSAPRNTHVRHPNPGHQQNRHRKPGSGRRASPPKASKPRASGVHKSGPTAAQIRIWDLVASGHDPAAINRYLKAGTKPKRGGGRRR
jgi:hypothetical protein